MSSFSESLLKTVNVTEQYHILEKKNSLIGINNFPLITGESLLQPLFPF